MAELVIGKWNPKPGENPEQFELPGPGLYEVDFRVPGYLVPDFVSNKVLTVPLGAYRVTHIRSFELDGKLTVRLKIEDNPEQASKPQVEFLGPLSVVQVLMVLAGATIGTFLMAQAVKFVTEIRKLAQTPAGIGLAALGIAGAALIVAGIFKGDG